MLTKSVCIVWIIFLDWRLSTFCVNFSSF